MNEDARTKSAFSTVEACRSVFKLDYPQLFFFFFFFFIYSSQTPVATGRIVGLSGGGARLLKSPKMWRLLMRVEKSITVLPLVPEPT